ncbi:hypothetical protein BDV96DRAFT_672970 [Lophiotrema nucula]|uniref:Uncharacterized protein n=1 Tax=Lophiotrema nucula TaxID=690887 RepID=A0A6A5YJY9_9PLEO|nr:hypothetical protein BDV96DRAFT_672970 [Lophiotrema nucula]
MPKPLPSNSTSSAPSRSTFAGDEFSNNIVSDLAPLLTLFGEQITKQFLSFSMGWADSILLAVGPLGIVTIVISTIRVGGAKRLKAFVGRARESKAAAEAELLSSTSANVCELWNGQEIVRPFGVPNTKELILYADAGGKLTVLTLESAVRSGFLKEDTGRRQSKVDVTALGNEAPNIALNITGATAQPAELWMWAIFGVLVQSSALLIPALSAYYWSWPKGDNSIPSYGFPCFIAGSVGILVGIILCSYTIEASTTEHDFILDPHISASMRPVYIQLGCTVGDQRYHSHLLCREKSIGRVRTSRLNDKNNK